MGKHVQVEILAAADFMSSSDSRSGFDCRHQDSLLGRILSDSDSAGHESGRHAQAPTDDYSSMARGTESRAWTSCEKDCLKAVLLMDDRTRYHRVGFAVRTPCLRACIGCLLTCADGKVRLSAKKP